MPVASAMCAIRWNARGACPRSALAKAAVLRTVFFSFAHPFCALCAEVWVIRWSTQCVRPRSALAETPCADGAVWLFLMSALVQVEHAMRAPPFGTRKSSRAAHCLFFFCPPILRFARRGVGYPVEHAMRAPPFGTRKSSCAAHCLFFFCPPILRFVRRGMGKRKTAPNGAAFARWCRWSDSNRHGFYSTGF